MNKNVFIFLSIFASTTLYSMDKRDLQDITHPLPSIKNDGTNSEYNNEDHNLLLSPEIQNELDALFQQMGLVRLSKSVPEQILLSCAICKKTENIQKCSRCKNTYYCSTSCQKKDWAVHKLLCSKQR